MSGDQELINRIVQEAQQKESQATPGGEVVDLTSSLGLLRLYRNRDSGLHVVGADSDWLRGVADEVARRIGAKRS